MNRVQLAATGVYHPSQEISTSDLLEESGITKLGVPRDSVSELLKITHVRHCADQEKPSELAAMASSEALKKAGVSPHEIDAILYCGIHKDCVEPATACIVADNLGIVGGRLQLANDLTSACHGLVASIDIIRHAILAGVYEHVLICSGEKPSVWYKELCEDIKQGKYSSEEARNLLGFFSCGDVGAATVLSRGQDGRGIVYFNSAVRPQFAASCHVGLGEGFGHMDMRAISSQTRDLVESMEPREISRKTGWDEPDYLIQHQVGMKPYLIGTRLFGVKKEKCPMIFPRFGNLTSASLVATIEHAGISKGAKVIISSTGSGISASQMAFVA